MSLLNSISNVSYSDYSAKNASKLKQKEKEEIFSYNENKDDANIGLEVEQYSKDKPPKSKSRTVKSTEYGNKVKRTYVGDKLVKEVNYDNKGRRNVVTKYDNGSATSTKYHSIKEDKKYLSGENPNRMVKKEIWETDTNGNPIKQTTYDRWGRFISSQDF